jgi:hypothetical protein
LGDRWLEWLVLAVLLVGFMTLIVWVNFYALDDDSPNPGDPDFRSGPDVPPDVPPEDEHRE